MTQNAKQCVTRSSGSPRNSRRPDAPTRTRRCSWPEVYLNNADIDRIYQLGQSPYFYQDYIEGKDVIISKHEPYHQTDHITKKKHLIHNWCDLMNLEYTGQTPVIVPNYPQSMLVGLWNRAKPIMVIQTCGGPMEGQKYSYSWTRDIPIEIAQEIVKNYSQQYHIIQITRPDGYFIDGVERMDQKMSNIELFSLLVASKKRVLIDSSLQHAAAALNLKSTVLWVGTSSKVFDAVIEASDFVSRVGRTALIANEKIPLGSAGVRCG